MTTVETRHDDDPGDALAVFFSYARADQKRAKPIIAALEAAGFRVWWDGLLEGGETYVPTTEAALESASAVVVLWSKTSVASHWVRDEATRGRERKCLVPLSIDGAEPPLGFRQFQVIDVSKWRGKADAPEAQSIVRAISALAGTAPLPARPSKSLPLVSRRLAIGGGATLVAAAAGVALWRSDWVGQGGDENSIAVLPFKNLSSDAEQGYFSDGLSEELRSILSRNRMLRVAAPTSSAGMRDQAADAMAVARKLDVAYVLRGSVQRAGNKVRIAAELINGKDAVVRWSEIFSREMRDVFTLQSEIANTVAVALVAEVAGKQTAIESLAGQQAIGATKNVAAYDAYLRGRALFDQSAGEDSDRAALAQFDKAVTIDVGFAEAHAMRAQMFSAIANQTGNTSEIRGLYRSAIASARRAIELAPRLARGHFALGFALNNGLLDTAAARAPYERARELAPGDADILRGYANFAAYNGDAARAAATIARSIVLDPYNARVFRAAGLVAYAARDYSAAIDAMRKALALSPKISVAHSTIGNAQYLLGRTDEAIAAFRAEPAALFGLAGLSVAHWRAGDRSAATAAMARLTTGYGTNGLYQQAQVLAQWGEQGPAFERLDQARAALDSGLLLAPTDPMLDPIRSDPRFSALLSWLRTRKS